MALPFGWPFELWYQIFLQMNSSLQLLFSNLLFTASLKKRPYYVLRLVLSLSLYAVVFVTSVVLRYYYGSVFTRVFVHMLRVSMLFFISYICYDENFHNRLRTICCGFAAREIGSAVYSFLLVLLGINEHETISLLHPGGYGSGFNTGVLDWLIYYAVHIAVYWLVYRIMPVQRYDELDRKSFQQTIILGSTCFFVLLIPDVVRNEIGRTGIADVFVNRFYLFSLSAFVLFVLNGIDFQSKYRREKAIMEQVLTDEHKQYRQLKDSMDVINMRCHDLKHQLDNFAGQLTRQEIESLREAMEFYDSNIKTGSDVLDVVLHTCQMRCQKSGIELTCLADGAALGFMDAKHLYSLFNNALGNAIEAAEKLDEPGKRTISVTVARLGSHVDIQITNYFKGPLPSPGGTTKDDCGHHGFGTMSMRYVAEQYGGSLTVRTEEDVYCLHISIPTPLA